MDDVLRQGVQGISDIITMPGLINLDFADVRAIMKDAGSALMGIGRASGENRAVEAARQAIASPLLEVNIAGAQGILFNITGSSNLSLFEVDRGRRGDPRRRRSRGEHHLRDELQRAARRRGQITVIATGFDGKRPGARSSASSTTSAPADATARIPRDFLEELERQRTQLNDVGVPDAPGARPDEAAARQGRSVGEPAPVKRAAYDAEDLEIPSFLRRQK